MFADFGRVANHMRRDSFAATVVRRREEIKRALRERGEYSFRAGGQEFTITVPRKQAESVPRGGRTSR